MGEAIRVRQYRDEDLPAVLELLRAALGETPLLRRTPELFRWKHIDNPFGRSVILVAESDDTIVGLRSFMRWDLAYPGGTIRCGRAVDTATHPAWMRRGIFRRLTTDALDVAREAGIEMIFNTPNERSRPGYLKMGWSDVGPIRVLVRLHAKRLLRSRSEAHPSLEDLAPLATPIDSDSQEALGFETERRSDDPNDGGLHTATSERYLRWRFAGHPTARYGAVVRSGGAAILRANLRNGRSELVISDALGPNPTDAVRLAIRNSRAHYDVAVFAPNSPGREAARRAGLLAVPGVTALQLVARPLDNLEIDVLSPSSWRFALSDLELL